MNPNFSNKSNNKKIFGPPQHSFVHICKYSPLSEDVRSRKYLAMQNGPAKPRRPCVLYNFNSIFEGYQICIVIIRFLTS